MNNKNLEQQTETMLAELIAGKRDEGLSDEEQARLDKLKSIATSTTEQITKGNTPLTQEERKAAEMIAGKQARE
jgi:hypothetical protein